MEIAESVNQSYKSCASYIYIHFKLLKCQQVQLIHQNIFIQDGYSTVGGEGECRVGKIRAGTSSTMPNHKAFKLGLQ